ncbi:MAG TPA: hypothetical protein VEY30_05690, partial [Myxococcaceae bacterium]|nr:hypothetical protein [Myxococcaceae bacterium]
LALSLAGCGEDTLDGGDGGENGFLLESGEYVASAASNVQDGCNQDPNNSANDPQITPLAGTKLKLTNSNGEVSLGDLVGTPPQPSQGKGFVTDNSGTLTRQNQVSTEQGACTYTRTASNEITVTADNTFTTNYTRTDSEHSAGCTQNSACTTRFTYTLTKD